MFCKSCGAQVAGDNRFCTTCGAPMVSSDAEYSQPVYTGPVPQTEPPKTAAPYRSKKRGMPFNPAAALFAIAGVVGVFLGGFYLKFSLLDMALESFKYDDIGTLILFLLPALFALLTFITSFLRSRISWIFAVLGVFSLAVYFVVCMTSMGSFNLAMIKYMAGFGFFFMLGAFLLNALSQIFYHPNKKQSPIKGEL